MLSGVYLLAPSIPINWHTIKTVFLDLDGTLLDLHFDNHFWLEHMPKRYAEKHTMPFEHASDLLLQKSKATAGSLNWYCLDHWANDLEMDVVALKHEVAHKIAVRENVNPFLNYLKEQDKRVVLLTNAHRKSLEVKFNYVDINMHFDAIITSHEIGLAKEQEGFWQMLEGHEDFDKSESLFIDDNLDVLNNAQRFGLKHLMTISQPDSQKPIKKPLEYPAIDDYRQLMDINY